MMIAHYYNLHYSIRRKAYYAGIEESICDIIKNPGKCQAIIDDISIKDKVLYVGICGEFPFLDVSSKIYADIRKTYENMDKCAIHGDIIERIQGAPIFRGKPSAKVLQKIILTGYPIYKLYLISNIDTRRILLRLLPGIGNVEALQLEFGDIDTNELCDIHTYEIVRTPIVYQNCLYDFASLMEYFEKSKNGNRGFRLGYSNTQQTDLNAIQLDFETLQNLRNASKIINSRAHINSKILFDFIYSCVSQQANPHSWKMLRDLKPMSKMQKVLYLMIEIQYAMCLYDHIKKMLTIGIEQNVDLPSNLLIGSKLDINLFHFRHSSLGFYMRHEFCRVIFEWYNKPSRCVRLKDLKNNLTTTFMSLLYVPFLDMALYTPLSMAPGQHKSYAIHFTIIALVNYLLCIAFAYIADDSTMKTFKSIAFSKEQLLNMLDAIIALKLQNEVMEPFLKQEDLTKNAEMPGQLLLNLAGVLILQRLIWTLFILPVISPVIDAWPKQYKLMEARMKNDFSLLENMRKGTLDQMQELCEHPNPDIPFKEGLFFWKRMPTINVEKVNNLQKPSIKF